MGKVIAGMTMSLDGFVADAEGNVDRLNADLADLQEMPSMTATIAETGAVLMGRKTFEMGDPDSYVGEYEFQVPIFVLTHHPPRVPPKQDDRLTFTFVQDGVASAVAQAKAAAGDKAVQVVGGVNVIEQLLHAGLVDELHVDVCRCSWAMVCACSSTPLSTASTSKRSEWKPWDSEPVFGSASSAEHPPSQALPRVTSNLETRFSSRHRLSTGKEEDARRPATRPATRESTTSCDTDKTAPERSLE